MYTYKEQLQVITSISIKEGERKTLDCPFCKGKNKFTIDRFDGKLVWNCYKASCTVRGAYTGERSLEAAKSYLSNNAHKRAQPTNVSPPKITTAVDNKEAAVAYLKSVNSYEAYSRGFIRIRYAPAEDRVLFYNKNMTGAVGRSLSPSKAKWRSYGDMSGGIHVGDGGHAVLVEDVASACSVARLNGYSGVAMLGTNVTAPILLSLKNYAKTTLVLDNDASSKAVYLARRHSNIHNVRLTTVDLKHLDEESVRCLLL